MRSQKIISVVSQAKQTPLSVVSPAALGVTPPPDAIALTLKDAARRSGCTEWYLRTNVWSGKLKARSVGNRLIVLADELDAFLRNLPAVRHGINRNPPQSTSKRRKVAA